MQQHKQTKSWTPYSRNLETKLHAPLAVEKQVVILYALTHGFLDSIPVDSILDFEHELFEYLDTNHSDIFETIRTTKIFQKKKR